MQNFTPRDVDLVIEWEIIFLMFFKNTESFVKFASLYLIELYLKVYGKYLSIETRLQGNRSPRQVTN